MGTPCAIGMKQTDGCVRAIRCNYDGYVGYAGAILGGWYTEPSKIEALLALGDLSELDCELDTCVAYHRDRGEQLRPTRHFASVEDFQNTAESKMSVNYLYLYEDGKWSVYGVYQTDEWMEVEVKKEI